MIITLIGVHVHTHSDTVFMSGVKYLHCACVQRHGEASQVMLRHGEASPATFSDEFWQFKQLTA